MVGFLEGPAQEIEGDKVKAKCDHCGETVEIERPIGFIGYLVSHGPLRRAAYIVHNADTEPRMVRCSGSGDLVQLPEEQS